MGGWPQEKRASVASPSQVVWQTLVELGQATITQLRRETYEQRAQIRHMLNRWLELGWVKVDGESPRVYQMVAPNALTGKANLPSAGQRMWKAMRATRTFDARDLAYLAQVSAATARRYLYALYTTGYLEKTRRGVRTKGGGTIAAYRLQRWTGQKAPKLLGDKRVWDANEQRIVPAARLSEREGQKNTPAARLSEREGQKNTPAAPSLKAPRTSLPGQAREGSTKPVKGGE